MLEIRMEANRLVLRNEQVNFRPRHVSQLAFWGFEEVEETESFIHDYPDLKSVLPKLTAYLDRERLPFKVDARLRAVLDDEKESHFQLVTALEQSARLKEGTLQIGQARDFLAFLAATIPRRLKEHQIKAALHLLASTNGANFSVPGSGKTAVVLTVFAWLRHIDEVDSLYVVGPPACFGPWQDEYLATLGESPRSQIVAGGNIDARRSQYLVTRDTVRDLYLTSFQTLQNDLQHVQILFQRQDIRFLFVVDEAHYIKQIGGAWAQAVLEVAKRAARRIVLTGTPFPRSFSDAFNLFDVLWPTTSPIPDQDRHRIHLHVQKKEYSAAVDILHRTIGPLYYRVRKSDLGLAPQVFHAPIRVQMNTYERYIYDAILDRINAASAADFFKNFDTLVKLRRGRMVRLRQCLSYAALLSSAVTDYQENLVGSNLSVADMIKQYDRLETPAKLEAATAVVTQVLRKAEKIVVWSNFIGTLKLLVRHLKGLGATVGLIYGDTPFERVGVEDEESREQVLRSFCDPNHPMNVLVANPAACAESISLHKVCSHALYYDLSYSCAQYLQSLDRIHRVGGSENKESNYYFLQYEQSIDEDVLKNVLTKARNMAEVIDRDYPIYALDMFAEDEELEAYERLFGKCR